MSIATPSTRASTKRGAKAESGEIAGYVTCDPVTGEPYSPEVNDWGESVEVALTRRGAARMLTDNEHGGDRYDLRPVTIKLAPFVPDQKCDGDADVDAAETATAAKETPHSREQPRGGSSVDETIAAKLAELTDLYAVYLDDDEDFKRGPVIDMPDGADRDGILDIAIGYKNAVHLAGQYADCSPRIVPIRISLDGPDEASTTQRRPAQQASSSTQARDAAESEGEPDPESEARGFLTDLLLLLVKTTNTLLDGKPEAIARSITNDDDETAAPSPCMKLNAPGAGDGDHRRAASSA